MGGRARVETPTRWSLQRSGFASRVPAPSQILTAPRQRCALPHGWVRSHPLSTPHEGLQTCAEGLYMAEGWGCVRSVVVGGLFFLDRWFCCCLSPTTAPRQRRALPHMCPGSASAELFTLRGTGMQL